MAAIIIPGLILLGGGWAGAGGGGGGGAGGTAGGVAGKRRAGLRNTADIMATGPRGKNMLCCMFLVLLHEPLPAVAHISTGGACLFVLFLLCLLTKDFRSIFAISCFWRNL